MLREAAGAVHHPEIKAGGVVVFHGKRIVPAVFIHQPDALQRISGQIQLIKNLNEILGDRLVADDLPHLFDIQNIQIPKVLIGNDAALSIGYACDPFLYRLAQRLVKEALLAGDTVRGDFRLCIFRRS